MNDQNRFVAIVRHFTILLFLATAGLFANDSEATNVTFVGNVAYTYVGSTSVLTADRVENNSTNTSGTLRMELWVFPSSFNGANQLGYKLAQYSLGTLPAGYYFYNINSGSVAFGYPPNGTWAVVMFLTEYHGGTVNGGYDWQDYINFAQPLQVGPVAPTPGQLSFVGSYNFGNQNVATTSTARSISLANVGGTAVSIYGITNNNTLEFSLNNGSCGSSLAPGSSCNLSTTFSPAFAGARSAAITISSSGVGSPQTIVLGGTGIATGPPPGQLSVTSAYGYGNITVGDTSAPGTLTVSNIGGVSVFVSSIVSSNPTEFPITGTNCGTVNAGSSCTFSFVFSPSVTGSRTATVSVNNNGAGGQKLVALSGTGVAGTAPPTSTTVNLIEYYNAGFDHYFVTGIADEITKLDNGTFVGWSRTGLQFSSYSLGSAGTAATCRFFSTTFAPKSSHFYTPNASECNVVKANPNWQFEGQVFGVALPDVSGNCASGNVPLYRVYNNGQGGAPNHRYTTSLPVRQGMLGQGWIPEGSGALGVIACVPGASAGPGPAISTAEGFWQGNTNTGSSIAGIVLENGVYYVIYTIPGTNTIGGFVQGNASMSNGQFNSSNAKDFSMVGGGVLSGSVGATYVPKSTLSGVISSGGSAAAFSANYDQSYTQPANVASLAGAYSGWAGSVAAGGSAVVNISSGGALSGNASGCLFSGAVTPHGSVNVYDISVTFKGGICVFGTSTLHGALYYDQATRTLYSAAPNAARSDGFLAVGTKQ